MWVGIAVLAGFIAFLWLNYKHNKHKEETVLARQEAQSSPEILATFKGPTPFNPNSYRFDGTAVPQYRISYADEDGVVTEREIYVYDWHKRGAVIRYECWCFLRDDRRTFRSDRILETYNLATGRRIRDIAEYQTR